ncbi:MAG: MmgE/PrpD family protein [Pseudomonadota bacterium]
MSKPSAITRLAHFIATHPRGEAKQAHLDRAADAVLDTLGCILLGRDTPVQKAALKACTHWGPGPVPIPGTDTCLPAPWAALVLGATAHSYDLDDYTLIANDHPSAVLVPAVLSQAASMQDDVSGAALLDAYLIGLEVIFRAGEAVNMGHYNRGWHTTSTLDSLGATAAVARLTRLTEEATAAALSLTTSMGSGFVSQFGTMAKPLHAGISAKAGILSCALASAGATASVHALDGPVSLSTIMTPPDVPGFDAALTGLGEVWGLDRFGLGAKLYPSCGYTHRAIDGALELHQRLADVGPEEISSVTLSLPDFHLAILPYGVPNTPDEALFSAPWCAAVALVTGACTSADFTPDAIARTEIRALAARTTALARSPLNPAINLDPADPDVVTVALSDGRLETARVDLWTGAPGRDLGRDGLIAKYTRNCAAAGMSPSQSHDLAETIFALSSEETVTKLFRHLS